MITTINQLKAAMERGAKSAKAHIAVCLESCESIPELHGGVLCAFTEAGTMHKVYLTECDCMLQTWLELCKLFESECCGDDVLCHVEVRAPHEMEFYSGYDDRYVVCKVQGDICLHGMTHSEEVAIAKYVPCAMADDIGEHDY